MKLTFITDEATQSCGEFITLARKHCLDAVELRNVDGVHVSRLPRNNLAEMKKRLHGELLKVCCLASPVFKSDFDDASENQFDKLRASLDTAALLDCPKIRIFSFWLREDRDQLLDRISELLRRAGEIARPYRIQLVIENGKRTMHRTGVELAELLNRLDQETFGALWDPGNCIFGGADVDPIRNGYPPVARFVAHVHIKDPMVYDGGSRAYVELGQGQLDLPLQMSALWQTRFAGYISLETHWRPNRVFTDDELDRPGDRRFSADGFQATDSSLGVLSRILDRCRAEAP
jgi:L-ribulose-5-phosphate 3-epimerase